MAMADRTQSYAGTSSSTARPPRSDLDLDDRGRQAGSDRAGRAGPHLANGHGGGAAGTRLPHINGASLREAGDLPRLGLGRLALGRPAHYLESHELDMARGHQGLHEHTPLSTQRRSVDLGHLPDAPISPTLRVQSGQTPGSKNPRPHASHSWSVHDLTAPEARPGARGQVPVSARPSFHFDAARDDPFPRSGLAVRSKGGPRLVSVASCDGITEVLRDPVSMVGHGVGLVHHTVDGNILSDAEWMAAQQRAHERGQDFEAAQRPKDPPAFFTYRVIRRQLEDIMSAAEVDLTPRARAVRELIEEQWEKQPPEPPQQEARRSISPSAPLLPPIGPPAGRTPMGQLERFRRLRAFVQAATECGFTVKQLVPQEPAYMAAVQRVELKDKVRKEKEAAAKAAADAALLAASASAAERAAVEATLEAQRLTSIETQRKLDAQLWALDQEAQRLGHDRSNKEEMSEMIRKQRRMWGGLTETDFDQHNVFVHEALEASRRRLQEQVDEEALQAAKLAAAEMEARAARAVSQVAEDVGTATKAAAKAKEDPARRRGLTVRAIGGGGGAGAAMAKIMAVNGLAGFKLNAMGFLVSSDGLYFWPDGRPLLGPDGRQIGSNSYKNIAFGADGQLMTADGRPLLDASGTPLSRPKRGGAPWGCRLSTNGRLVNPSGKPLLDPRGVPIPPLGNEGVPFGFGSNSNGFLYAATSRHDAIPGEDGRPLSAIGYCGVPAGCTLGPDGFVLAPDGSTLHGRDGKPVTGVGTDGIPEHYRVGAHCFLIGPDDSTDILTGPDGRALRPGEFNGIPMGYKIGPDAYLVSEATGWVLVAPDGAALSGLGENRVPMGFRLNKHGFLEDAQGRLLKGEDGRPVAPMGLGGVPHGFKVGADGFLVGVDSKPALIGPDAELVTAAGTNGVPLNFQMTSHGFLVSEAGEMFRGPDARPVAPMGLRGVPAGCAVDADGFLVTSDGTSLLSPDGVPVSAAGMGGVPHNFRINKHGFVENADGTVLRGPGGLPLAPKGLDGVPEGCTVDGDGFLLSDGRPLLDMNGERVSAVGSNGVPHAFKLSSTGALLTPDGRTLLGHDGRPVLGGQGMMVGGRRVDRNKKALEELAARKKFEREKRAAPVVEKPPEAEEIEITALDVKLFGFGGGLQPTRAEGSSSGGNRITTKAAKWQKR